MQFASLISSLINIIILDVTSFNSAVTLKLKCGKVVCLVFHFQGSLLGRIQGDREPVLLSLLLLLLLSLLLIIIIAIITVIIIIIIIIIIIVTLPPWERYLNWVHETTPPPSRDHSKENLPPPEEPRKLPRKMRASSSASNHNWKPAWCVVFVLIADSIISRGNPLFRP